MGRNRSRSRGNRYNNHWGNRGLSAGTNVNHEPLRASYRLDEHIGSEDRATEFKNGPGFIKHGFRESIAKYVCGFVNSQENGSLLIGVGDDGKVRGYNVTHNQEDSLRREFDEAVKDMEPSLFPQDYSIHFVPVTDEYNQPFEQTMVIEILVFGANIDVKGQLYSNKQGVFVRRDGSIQELSARDIQEWTRRQYQGEIDKLQKNQANLEEELACVKNKEKSKLRQLEQKLQEKNEHTRQKETEVAMKVYELNRQESKLNQLSDQLRKLEEENERLRQQKDASGAQGTSDMKEQINRLEARLEQQMNKLDQIGNLKKSKVCTIS